ncbi:ERG2 and sigma1 receptor-like protein [Atractiella rhizophila]|nr:ERG2 and sigma1 receptor-like protein [Atractiella rhizophila]
MSQPTPTRTKAHKVPAPVKSVPVNVVHVGGNKASNSRNSRKKASKGGNGGCWAFFLVVLALFGGVVKWYDGKMKDSYIFDHNHLNVLANRAIASVLSPSSPVHPDESLAYPSNYSIVAPHRYPSAMSASQSRAIFDALVAELKLSYPEWTLNLNEEWVFNNAGGAMGAMWILHASISEYLIIFGTPLGTEGHSGRHLADDYFTILTGEQWAYAPGPGVAGASKQVYPPGSTNHLPRGQVIQYKMHDGCFALELAQGWIPSMLFFGFADYFTSVLDWETLYNTVRITIRENVKNAWMGKF